MMGGQIFYMGLPMIVSSPLLPIFESPEFTPGMISLIGWVGIILLPLCIGIAVLLAPAGKHVSTASYSNHPVNSWKRDILVLHHMLWLVPNWFRDVLRTGHHPAQRLHGPG
jgi:glucose-6-phosphate-specific signal transduction histidine kinase